MDNSALKILCGSRVVDATLDSGDAGIAFDNGACLAIYNKLDVLGGVSTGPGDLTGKAVLATVERECSIDILLENGITIRVDMNVESYNGPEAMQLRMPGKPIVVWN